MDAFLKRLAPIWVPHPGQEAFLRADAPYRVLACGRRWGKTDATAVEMLFRLLRRPGTQALLVAPTLTQARILFDRVLAIGARLRDAGEAALEDWKLRQAPHPRLILADGAIEARSAHVANNLRGAEATDVAVDEAAYVAGGVVEEVLFPMLATTRGRLTLISTPRGLDAFWRMFRRGEEGRPGFWSRRAPSAENPRVPPEFLDLQRELASRRAFAVEYEAAFLEPDGAVFRVEAIEAARVGELPPAEGTTYVGLDFGRVRDHSAIAVLSGDRGDAWVHVCRRIGQREWQVQVEEIRSLLDAFPGALVNCDGTGIGDGVLAMLREAMPDRGIADTVLTQATKERMIEGLATLFERGALHMLPNPPLERELAAFESRGGRLGARGAEHDDLVIALALAAWQLPARGGGRVMLGTERRF